MWESRVLCEISKSLWKPFCGFHRDVISTAVIGAAHNRAAERGCCTLTGLPFVAPGVSYAVAFDRDVSKNGRATRAMFYLVPSSGRKSVWTFVRQLRGPHLSTCA